MDYKKKNRIIFIIFCTLFVLFSGSIILSIYFKPQFKFIPNNNSNSNKVIDYNSVIKIWPYPYQVKNGVSQVTLSKEFIIMSQNKSNILDKAIERYQKLIFEQDSKIEISNSTLNFLNIIVTTDNEKLDFGFNESYTLIIDDSNNKTQASLQAETVYGIIRGLETFYQLVQYDYGEFRYYISNCSWYINDKPRFPHRGLLVDTSRRFIPIPTIQLLLDSLAYNKFNTFHWHVIDSQAFPLSSVTFPNITSAAWSSREIYSYKDIYNVIDYAKERGIRVLLELDMPGHSGSWGKVFNILPDNYNIKGSSCPWNCTEYCDVPIDPINPNSIKVASALLEEFSKVFNDSFFHVGGDEINYGCWSGSSSIQSWMSNNGLSNFNDLTIYFENQIFNKLIDLGKTPVVWEETFNVFGSKLSKDIVVQIYHSPSLAQSTTSQGYKTLLSPAEFYYLELPYSSWDRAYSFEPTSGVSQENVHFILGGEGAIWTDTIGVNDLIAKVYPSACSIAEKLWSPIYINDTDIAQYRLESFHCSLIFRGINSNNLFPTSINHLKSCYNS